MLFVSSQKLAIDGKSYLRCESKNKIMYSSEGLERLYFQYQTETLPHGESLLCLKYKVPYNIFQKWFKDTRKNNGSQSRWTSC